jgi:hypothetical protein
MSRIVSGLALGALIFALAAGFARPAAAEFFGCNDQHATRSSSYSRAQSYARASSYTHEFAAQQTRPRVTVYPRHAQLPANAKRQCRAWLVKEYRVSGTVIVPRQQCWWE